MIDGSVPVVVGAATTEQSPRTPDEGLGCSDLLISTAAAALDDSGVSGLASRVS